MSISANGFHPKLIWVTNLFWITLLFGPFLMGFVRVNGSFFEMLYPISGLGFILWLRYLMYQKTTFYITDYGISYERNFVFMRQKSVKYSDIKEVDLRRGPIQMLFGLGTVKVTTQATKIPLSNQNTFNIQTQMSRAGLKIYNIPNWKEVYDVINAKVHGTA